MSTNRSIVYSTKMILKIKCGKYFYNIDDDDSDDDDSFTKWKNDIFSSPSSLRNGHRDQCDKIGRFIAPWVTFQSLWQQLFCSNRPHFRPFL